jgi:hypothetical protein
MQVGHCMVAALVQSGVAQARAPVWVGNSSFVDSTIIYRVLKY